MDLVTLSGLPERHQISLKNSAKIAQSLENYWLNRIEAELEGITPTVVRSLEQSGKIPPINFERIFIEHFFDVSIRAFQYAERAREDRHPVKTKTLALPKARMPQGLSTLMRMYDLWKKGKYKPKRAVAHAKAVKKEYLKRVQSVWEENSRDFRKGDVFTQEKVVAQIKQEAKTTVVRAQVIVRTETTNYYNDARKNFYDQSQDITHYLFIAIRDAATSPWCSPNKTNGKRGRSGLVYHKDDPLLKKERPACHPNCRSEILPLNRLDPEDLRYIQNESIQRRNNECYPLIKGWGK